MMKKQPRQPYSLSRTLLVSIVSMSMLVGVFGTIVVRAAPTVVIVDPSFLMVNASTSFFINISCSPGQPIKAFELKLSFDPDFMRVDSVTEGDIFTGYSTFFSDGEINNNQGRVLDIYNIILGKANVTGAGTLVMLSCTAKSYSGTSVLNLYDVGVTNEVGYVDIVVTDGSVTVQGGGSPPAPPPPGGGSNPPEPPEENVAPETPLKPVGPVFVEPDVVSTYSSVSWDVDGDLVQLLFDWDDGTTSEWSAWVTGNQTVNMSHSWNTTGSYLVQVLARDSEGENSTWSPSLEVVVSAIEEEPPSIAMDWAQNSSSLMVEFDAGGCVDSDGMIVSYIWDFGDGRTGSGKLVYHTYALAGNYSVTLTVTDDMGNVNTTVFYVSVMAPVPGQSAEHMDLGFLMYLIPLLGGVGGIVVVYYYRTDISLLLSRWSVQRAKRKMSSVDSRSSLVQGPDEIGDVGEKRGLGELLSPSHLEMVLDDMKMPVYTPDEYAEAVREIDRYFMSMDSVVFDHSVENEVDQVLQNKGLKE